MLMGNVQLTHEELEAMLDRAAKRGARAALQELGLHDENAPRDLDELRGLLSAWRDTRSTMWQTAVKIITTGTLMFMMAALWMSFKDRVGQ
jgi:2-iminoacetate synthase ThiH